MTNRPNVLWINTDQHTFRALGCAEGVPHDIETPNLDRLAREGVFFERAYSPSPVCGPARASLFTGLYPQEAGTDGNNGAPGEGVRTLPELLRENGYHTGLVGKLHFSPKSGDHGFVHKRLHDAMYDIYRSEEPWTSDYVRWLADEKFDGDVQRVIDIANEDEASFHERGNLYRFLMGSNWRTEDEHSNTWVTDETIDYLRNRHEESFFCFTSYFGPHQPMHAPGRWADMYDPEDVQLPPEFDQSREKPSAAVKRDRGKIFRYYDRHDWPKERYREVLAAYYGQVSMIDHGIGRILDALEEEGLTEDTIVVFTSDHGDHAGQLGWFGKSTMYETSVRIPLIVRDPQGAAGARTDHAVNNLGLFQTVLDQCGVDYRETSSRSLVPLLEEPNREDWEDETYSELGKFSMLVRDDYKLIRAQASNGDYVYELYDTTARPLDDQDLWDTPELQDKQDDMVRTLQRKVNDG
ncbi:sulfatase family protein [Halomontanus rarus]|uniref:sulfatase family protein n=1 Tax=Halomontanus rarus TaxID=3034020 RepID=UPI0023E75A97|nr:sulfatase-like hydrolase/transferase [Halovivax sp. TS33]